MQLLALHEFHHDLGAHFGEERGMELVNHYSDPPAEHVALRNTAGVLDLSFRGRLCLMGADRVRFLHGQVTNDVIRLRIGDGCYAALVTAKGKMQSDLNIYCLPDELLLDFEPGLSEIISQRLEKYIIADDVQVVDATPHYGQLSVQGPKAESVVRSLDLFPAIPDVPFSFVKVADTTLGEIYLINHARLLPLNPTPAGAGEAFGLRGQAQRDPALVDGIEGDCETKAPSPLRSAGALQSGFDLFVPAAALSAVADRVIAAARQSGGQACGWQALETARIEAGIPRFGVDMDETNIPLETGLENRAVSFNKGCYIGQEVIARIRTYGQVAKALRGLRLADDLKPLPAKGDKLFHAGKEVGYVTSALASPTFKANIALGYVRKEVNQIGTELTVRMSAGESLAKIVPLPFESAFEASPGQRLQR
jgi:folate-binding protein YgfZ